MGCGQSSQQKLSDTIENVKNSKKVVIDDLSLKKRPYFDLLSILSKNKNVRTFKLKNVEISKYNN